MNDILAVAKRLKTATSFVQIFGKMPAGDVDAQTGHLKKQFLYLVNIVHPDHVSDHKTEATEAFRLLNAFRKEAEEAIRNKTYETKIFKPGECSVSTPAYAPTILTSPTATYKFVPDIYKEGDFSVIYRAKTETDREVLIKVSSAPENNPLLEHEAKILKRFAAGSGTGNLMKKKFLPELIDTFIIPDGRGKRFRANVFPFYDGYYSLTEIMRQYPKGLDPRDAAWICRRLIAQAIAASMGEVVHTAITPDHVLVHPVTHEPIHIGWVHALDIKDGVKNRVSMIVDRYKDWYPPEVLKKKQPGLVCDFFMAGKTMIQLLGGDTRLNTIPKEVPNEFARTVLRCVESDPKKRPSRGREFMDEFTKMLERTWGRKYRKLEMKG